MTAQWVDHAIWWQVFPLGFTGAAAARDPQAPVRHSLPRIIGWLDRAVELGVNGLALGPVFESQSHGYDTTDHFRVDPRLGDEDDFHALADACHERGLRLMLDGVFNHVGTGHPAFRRLVREGPGAETADWFRVRFDQDWRPGQEPDYDTFEGASQLAVLNHDAPAVADLVTDVMCHWLERGADAWRLDAAYAVPPAFWREVLPRVRERFGEAYVMGEVIHGDYPGIVTESGMDAVTQYELWAAIHSSLRSSNFFELDHALGRHNGFLETFVPYTFLGNHDTTRIASQLPRDELLPLALVLLFTLGGTPSIYYGDETGARAVKEERLGGDDAIRPAFGDAPGPEEPFAGEVFALHRELISLRRRHAWLHRGRTAVTHLTNTAVVYDVSAGDQRITVALNNAAEPVSVPLNGLTERLAGTAHIDDGTAHLEGFGWSVCG